MDKQSGEPKEEEVMGEGIEQVSRKWRNYYYYCLNNQTNTLCQKFTEH